MLRPFFTPILGSFVIAYLSYPLYEWVQKRLKNKSVAAAIVAFVVILLFIFPAIFFIQSAIKEASVLYITSKQFLAGSETCGSNICVPPFLEPFMSNVQFESYVESGIRNLTSIIIQTGSSLILSLPIFLLNAFIAILVTFFMLKDGHRLIAWLKRVTPFDNKFQNNIFEKIENVTSAVIHGQFLIALVVGVLGGLAFFAFGLPSPILWGSVMAVLSFLPVIGSSFVYGPAALLLIFSGIYTDQYSLVLKGIGLFLFGAVVLSSIIENIIKPRMVGDKAQVHPLVILLGLLGGIPVFGIIGIVLGPIVLALFITFLDVYERDVI